MTDPQESRDAALDRVMAAAKEHAYSCPNDGRYVDHNIDECPALQREVEQYGERQFELGRLWTLELERQRGAKGG